MFAAHLKLLWSQVYFIYYEFGACQDAVFVWNPYGLGHVGTSVLLPGFGISW